ncbi:Wzz/FepE/Etk N-terminal domain-containing protein [Pseudomonas sp. D1-3]
MIKPMPERLRTPQQNDEIDLFELFRKLWAKKWLIIGTTVATTLFAAAYAFLTSPVYRAQASVMPPMLSDIAGFNLARNKDIGLEPFKVNDVYRVFTNNLQSDQSKRRFYSEVYLPSLSDNQKKGSRDGLYQAFLRRLTITGPTTSQPDRFVLNIEGKDPSEAAQWAERYIKDVERQSIDEMLSNAQSEIQVRGRNLMQQIEVLRESAKVRREDRLIQLKEAFKVAQAIGLENPPMIAGQMNDQLSAIMEGNLTYMRGAKALKAEIDALTQRESDDPFVPGLRNLQEQHALYASLRIQPERVAVFRLDGAIEIPDQPIKPKKFFILASGVALGALLGGILSLLLIVINGKKRVSAADEE